MLRGREKIKIFGEFFHAHLKSAPNYKCAYEMAEGDFVFKFGRRAYKNFYVFKTLRSRYQKSKKK